MLAVIFLLTALTVALFALTLMQLRPGRGARDGSAGADADGQRPQRDPARRRRQVKSERLKSVLQVLGQRVEGGRNDTTAVRQFLIQAGLPRPERGLDLLGNAGGTGGGIARRRHAAPAAAGRIGRTQVLLGLVWLGDPGMGRPHVLRPAAGSRLGRRKSSLPWPTCSTCWWSAWKPAWGSTRRWSGWPTRSTT